MCRFTTTTAATSNPASAANAYTTAVTAGCGVILVMGGLLMWRARDVTHAQGGGRADNFVGPGGVPDSGTASV
ncbi:hypothetical protein GCM10009641_87150 [Mycobacterium cookii]